MDGSYFVDHFWQGIYLIELSMDMCGGFETGIEEGVTVIQVG